MSCNQIAHKILNFWLLLIKINFLKIKKIVNLLEN
jgi:hypothetical protein